MWHIWIIFILFNKLISKWFNSFEIYFIDYLIDIPPCLNIIFINNIHVHFQCINIFRHIMVAFIVSCDIRWILNLFLGNNQDVHSFLHLVPWDLYVLFLLSPQQHSPLNIRILLYLAIHKLHLCLQFFYWPLNYHLYLHMLVLLGFQNMFHR